MARAETAETAAGAGGRGHVPLSQPSACRMELPRPLHGWPASIPAGPSGAALRALCVSYRDRPASPPPSPPSLCSHGDASGDPSDSDGRGRRVLDQVSARRVGRQLRTIGDQFDAAVHRRMHVAPLWQDWGDVCRGLLGLVAQTLRAFYRLT